MSELWRSGGSVPGDLLQVLASKAKLNLSKASLFLFLFLIQTIYTESYYLCGAGMAKLQSIRSTLASVEQIERTILVLRGHRVMIDNDLAALYGVETFNLNKAVKRNAGRFPEDFMFQLTREEFHDLRFQIGISKQSPGGRRYLPYVFTEQGVAMLSSVLRSERAVKVNITIMRTFVKLREMLATHKELAQKLAALEEKIGEHDAQIRSIIEAIRQLMASPEPKRRPIGFDTEPKR
jgi:hypothetical protein